jgi:hypothetical protein
MKASPMKAWAVQPSAKPATIAKRKFILVLPFV